MCNVLDRVRLAERERQRPQPGDAGQRETAVVDVTETGPLSYERLIEELRKTYGN